MPTTAGPTTAGPARTMVLGPTTAARVRTVVRMAIRDQTVILVRMAILGQMAIPAHPTAIPVRMAAPRQTKTERRNHKRLQQMLSISH
jgi:hypothetical protein